MVGSDIQVITLKNGDFLVFNENGLMKNLKNNNEATNIYHKNGGIKNMRLGIEEGRKQIKLKNQNLIIIWI